MAKKKEKKEKEARKDPGTCPICYLQQCAKDAADKNAEFFAHMNRARIEFLKGIKSLVDSQIKDAQKRTDEGERKVSKIRVED